MKLLPVQKGIANRESSNNGNNFRKKAGALNFRKHVSGFTLALHSDPNYFEPRSIYHRTKLEAEQFLEAEASRDLKVTTLRMSRCFPEPAPIMAMYRLHRGIDARDAAEAHRLALVESDEDYRMFTVSGATPFQRVDCRSLKRAPGSVLRERCLAICATFESRGWSLPDSIDRVYDSSRAQQALGWKPVFGFEEVIDLLDNQISEVLPEQAEKSRVSE